jgi:hypothetical protein
VPRRVEQVVLQGAPVDRERAQHHAVHEHPADEGRGRAFVEAEEAFVPEGGGEAVEGAGEVGGRRGLKADFEGVEGVADWEKGGC